MGKITYTAVDRGRLVDGHSEGTEYTIEVGMELDTPSTKTDSNKITNLRKSRVVTTLFGKEYYRKIRTVWVDDLTTQRQFDEFFDSVAGGEEFVVDPYGTVASPADEFLCTLEGDPTQTRYKRMERWKYAFKVRYDPSFTVYN